MKLLLLFICLLFSCAAEEEVLVQRVKNLIFLGDTREALAEAETMKEKFPASPNVKKAYFSALAAAGFEKRALLELKDISYTDDLLEEVGWSYLKKGLNSDLYLVKLSSLVGAYMTQDVRAVDYLIKMMRSSDVLLRSLATKLAADYGDEPLRQEVRRLLHKEKVWQVRLEAIYAAGIMRIREERPFLESIVTGKHYTFEERALAIESLINMYDELTVEEVEALAQSPKSGLRELSSEAAIYFDLKEAKRDIVKLINDPVSSVRLSALKAIVLMNLEGDKELRDTLDLFLNEKSSQLSIAAAWAYLRVFGEGSFLEKWLSDSNEYNRRMAAGALASSGDNGKELLIKSLSSTDNYVKINAAIGLLGLRKEVKRSSDVIYDFLKQEKSHLMWDEGFFRHLEPSRVSFVEHIPNYPEAVDQLVRIDLLSLLTNVDDPRAVESLKDFLKQKMWRVSGAAAAVLLKEGDEGTLNALRAVVNDPDPEISIQAAIVLASLGRDESVLPLLKERYEKADREMKEYLLEALGHIGGREASTFFLKSLEEPFQSLRVISAAGLVKSLNQ